jgi:hypothetical protein
MTASRRRKVQPPPLEDQFAVWNLSAVGDDVWAVGLDRFPGPALIMHSASGEPWQLMPYSSPGDPLYTQFSGVHATSSDDVWAVGSERVPYRILILHFDGTTWQPVDSPDNADGQHLSAVAAWGRDDAFAVGSGEPATSSRSGLPSPAMKNTLAVRWDGTQWAAVPGPGRGILTAVCAVGPGAYWAAGVTAHATRAGDVALLAQYADGQWQQVDSEVAGALFGVAATGPDDVWAVGNDHDSSHPAGPLILHYDGHTWAPASVPDLGGWSWLNAVASAGRDNVWAVGGKQRDDGSFGPFVMHFNGSAWAAVDPPGLSGELVTGQLQTVIVLPSGEAWAAGQAIPGRAITGFMLFDARDQ